MRIVLLATALLAASGPARAVIDCSASGPFGAEIEKQPAKSLCELAQTQEKDILHLTELLVSIEKLPPAPSSAPSIDGTVCPKTEVDIAPAPRPPVPANQIASAAQPPLPLPVPVAPPSAPRETAPAPSHKKPPPKHALWKPPYCRVAGMARYPECH